MMGENGCITCYDLTVRADAIEDDVFPVLKDIRPHWEREDVLTEVFTKGFVNSMACFYHKDDALRREALVVRVYGAAIGDMNPRDKEFMNIQIAHAAGCFPAIYACFNNGLVYQYAQGRHANFHDIVKPDVARTITRLLYRLHNVDIDKLSLVDRRGNPIVYDKTPTLFDETMELISSIPDAPKNAERTPKFKQFRESLNNKVLLEEFEFLKSVVDEVHFPVSFSHMDFHPRNIIINDETGDITFVDYETSSYSYTYFDLASLFNCKKFYDMMGLATPEEPDVTPDMREQYLQSYMEAKHETEGSSEIPDVESELLDIKHRILDKVQIFQALVMGLAMVDMEINDKFDFLDLTPMLKEYYFSSKDALVALKIRYVELKLQALNPFAE